MLHDSFLRYALSGRHRGLDQPHAYLRTVVRSVLADHFADATRYVPLPSEEDASPGATATPAWGGDFLHPSAEALADLQQRLRAMQKVIDALPPRCRDVFWLCRVEGCTQPEIAQRLGISLNMVERHMIRALLDLLDLRAARERLAP